MDDKLEEALRKLKEASLKWHVGDNLRWLADQSDRPGHVPCGMLTGAFLITVADNYEQLTKEEREAADEITRLNAENERIGRERDCYKANLDARDLDLKGAFEIIDDLGEQANRWRNAWGESQALVDELVNIPSVAKALDVNHADGCECSCCRVNALITKASRDN